MIEMGLQEIYNILSIVGFGFCMYKIHRMEVIIELLKTNQLLSALTNFALTKTLKDKGLIENSELEIEIKKAEE
jgi:hypothetical protein